MSITRIEQQLAAMEREQQASVANTSHSVIPLWVGHYLNLPYKISGRCMDGLDDWGLVRLIQREQFGREIVSANTINSLPKRELELVDMLMAKVCPSNGQPWETPAGSTVGAIIAYRIDRKRFLFGTDLGSNRVLFQTPGGSAFFSPAEDSILRVNYRKKG